MTTFLVILASIIGVLIYLGYRWSAPDLSRYDKPEDPLLTDPANISGQHQEVVRKLSAYHGQPRTTNIRTGRSRFEEVFGREVDINIQPVVADGVPGEWVLAEGADPDKRVLYIHGGAFMVGSPKTHRFLTSEISKRTGASVLAIDYRMQPEHKIVRCHEDVRTAYRWILAHGPGSDTPTGQLYVAGDSAGGNLTLSVIAWARDNGLKAADGAIAFAPLTDSTLSSPSWKENISTDHFLGPGIGKLLKIPGFIRNLASRLQSGTAANDPMLSPLLGNLSNLPATLIQVSRHEMLYSDAQRYANKARHEGSEVTLQVWPTLVHVFQGFGELPEAHDALDRVAAFIRKNSRQTSE